MFSHVPVYLSVDLGLEDVGVIISMLLACDASDVVGYNSGRSRPRLCNATINRKYDKYGNRDIAL